MTEFEWKMAAYGWRIGGIGMIGMHGLSVTRPGVITRHMQYAKASTDEGVFIFGFTFGEKRSLKGNAAKRGEFRPA